MKVIFDVGHPAHAHFFKYVIEDLMESGHEIKLAARSREMLFYLLDRFGFDYTDIGRTREGLVSKATDMLKKDLALIKVVDAFKPDLMLATGSGSPYSAQVGKLKNIPNITCTDTEHARFINWLTIPFAGIVCTPESYRKAIRAKYHVRYNGYHELAYLHPYRFKPTNEVLDSLNLSKDDKIILIKFAKWTASHDMGVSGFNFKNTEEQVEFIRNLNKYGRVFICSEIPLPKKLKKYELSIPYEQIHDLISNSALYFGEGATMASEAAVLGIPSIFISTLRLGYLDELQDRYQLVYSFSDLNSANEQAIHLLTDPNVKTEWKAKAEKMINEKIDVSKFITELILNFPESIEAYRI